MAWELRTTGKRIDSDIVSLLQAGLIEDRSDGFYMHNWDSRQFLSDDVGSRVKKHRQKRKVTFHKKIDHVSGNSDETLHVTCGNVHSNGGETLPEADTETETETHTEIRKAERPLSVTELALERVAREVHERHPALRRCALSVVRKQLKAIVKKLPQAAWPERLDRINMNHAAWCSSSEWQKENGKYAKGLENWLAPTVGRFDEEPPMLFQPPPAPRRLLIPDYD